MKVHDGTMKALDVECPSRLAAVGEPCRVDKAWYNRRTNLGHAHGGRSRLVAIRATLARSEHLALDNAEDREQLEHMLMEALS